MKQNILDLFIVICFLISNKKILKSKIHTKWCLKLKRKVIIIKDVYEEFIQNVD